MSAIAHIENGEIVTSATQDSLSKSKPGTANKDDFLQLLVAQMKYQDPMEPTENTQWVSQYAQFSQVEELQNMAQNMSLSRASGLVGQTVIMSVENEKGEATEVEGNVDFVSYEGGNAFLSINGELYAMSDLKHVVDSKYLAAMENTKGFVEALGKLPDVKGTPPPCGYKATATWSIYEQPCKKTLSVHLLPSLKTLKHYTTC